MKNGQRRSPLSYIPGYSNNAVIQLIIFSGAAYVVLGLIWGVIWIVYQTDLNFKNYFLSLISLPAIADFKTHFWTVVTYGWFLYPGNFWSLLSNMLWLYCFGSIVQNFIGFRQVIPMYAYSIAMGGAFYLLTQLIPGIALTSGKLGPEAGLVGLAIATVTISPKFRLYFSEYFSVPLFVVVAVFVVLMVVGTGFYPPSLLLLAGGALSGFGYVWLLQAGYRPGAWMYQLTGRIEGLVTPKETKYRSNTGGKRSAILNKTYNTNYQITQKKIDELLDKINQNGYTSLT